MPNMSRTLLFQTVGILLFLFGCRQDELAPAKYVQYIRNPKNGFIQAQHFASGIAIEAFYQPPAYLALMQAGPGDINKHGLEKVIMEQENFYQFLVSIKSNTNLPIDEQLEKQLGNGLELSKIKDRMFYQMQSSFILIAGKDSLPCTFYHAQPSGKIDNAYHFITVFEKLPSFSSHDLNLLLQDSLYFGRGFNFYFDSNSIAHTPKLKL
jgi:hypothetical protein